MKKNEVRTANAYISLGMIIFTLLMVVFVKMEIRRSGYVLWKQSRVAKQVKDDYYRYSVKVAQFTGPHRIHKYAQGELSMGKASFGQIIQMTNHQVALKQ